MLLKAEVTCSKNNYFNGGLLLGSVAVGGGGGPRFSNSSIYEIINSERSSIMLSKNKYRLSLLNISSTSFKYASWFSCSFALDR